MNVDDPAYKQRSFSVLYFGARYINPVLAQFLSTDKPALFSGLRNHAYLYVDGRVFLLLDPDGNAPAKASTSQETTLHESLQENTAKAAEASKTFKFTGGKGSLPSAFWVIDAEGIWRVRSGADRAEAIKSIFSGSATISLDCLRTVKVVLLKGLLDTVGADRFNQMFPSLAVGGLWQTFGIAPYIKSVNIKSASEVKRGDWLMLPNYPELKFVDSIQAINAIVTSAGRRPLRLISNPIAGSLTRLEDALVGWAREYSAKPAYMQLVEAARHGSAARLRRRAFSVPDLRTAGGGWAGVTHVMRIDVKKILNPAPQPKSDNFAGPWRVTDPEPK